MVLFDNVLRHGESIFADQIALDFDYQPKLVPFREGEQHYIASCIKPLFQKRNGRNLFVFGPPGVGKTVAVKHVLRELEEQTEEVVPVYINCWQKNTSYKILLQLCDIIDYKFTQNKKSDELSVIVKQSLNKRSVVLVLDEADKLEDLDFLYFILEEIFRKSVILITNFKEWILELDERIRSRLAVETLEFKPYSFEQIKDILNQRVGYAFVPNVWSPDALELAARKAFELKDLRAGLHILREAGNSAEEKAAKKITIEDVSCAVSRLDSFSIKKSTDLEEDTRLMLNVIKENSGSRIGELFDAYRKLGGGSAYKTFQRKVDKLEKGRYITTKKQMGAGGQTTIISYAADKKLTEF